jgi:hypothetical protein
MAYENRFRRWVQRFIMLANTALSVGPEFELHYYGQLDNESKTPQARCMFCFWKLACGSPFGPSAMEEGRRKNRDAAHR